MTPGQEPAASGVGHSMRGDELGPCPCGHRMAMCHRENARRYCPPDRDLARLDAYSEALRRIAQIVSDQPTADRDDMLRIARAALKDSA